MSAARPRLPRFRPADLDGPGPRAAWERDGVVVVDGAVDPAEVARLRARAALLRARCAAAAPASIFDTAAQSHGADDWFQGSGGAIRAFFEPGLPDPPPADRARWVNKLGHALHDRDPVFGAACRSPLVARLVTEVLGVGAPLLVQSMLIFKEPGIGAAVPLHQDATFLQTRPDSVVGLWLALDEATDENGPLEVVLGGQHETVRARFRRRGGRCRLETVDPRPLPAATVAVPAAPGTLVAFHGCLPHGSAPNRGRRPRWALTLHVVDGAARWLPDNWLQRDTPFRGFGSP